MEICINEYIFNNTFWVYSSFYNYIYDNVNVKLKGSKHKKTMSGFDFREKYIGKKCIFDKDIIQIKNNIWKTKTIQKSKGNCFVRLYTNIYFKVDSKLFTMGKYKLQSDIILDYDDCKLYDKSIPGKFDRIYNLQDILETYVSELVISKLEVEDFGPTYRVKNRIKLKNKKLNKKKYKLKKFVRRYFIDIKG